MANEETYHEMVRVFEKVQKLVPMKNFYVVTYPAEASTLRDIVFKSDVKGLIYQVGGGLQAKEIFGIYTKKSVANRKGNLLIDVKSKSGCPVGTVYKEGRCVKK